MKEQFIRAMKIFCVMMCMTIIDIVVISIQVDAESYRSMYDRACLLPNEPSGQVYTEEIDGVLWRVVVDENKNVFVDSETTLPENVVIPEIVAGYRVTNIGYRAFDNHQEIKNITIPSGVTTIHIFAFTQCFNLININVVPENQAFCSLDGVLYTKQKDVLVSFPNGRTGSYKIPSGVKAIGYCAFDDALLNELWIPESVGIIGAGAFNPCNDTSPYGEYQPLTKIYYEGNYEEVSNLYDRFGYFYICDTGDIWKCIDNIYFLAPDCQIGSEKTKYSQFRYEEIKPIEVKNGSTDKYQNNVSYVGGELTYQWYRGTVLYKEVSYDDYVKSVSRREIDWDQTLANSELLAGETESSYIPSFRNQSKDSYFCIITNNYMGKTYKTVSNVVEIEFTVPEGQIYTEEIDGVLWRVVVDENEKVYVYIDFETTLPENVVIPEIVAGYRVTNLEIHAFDNRQEIKSITIPSGVTTIHPYAFTQCFNLININVVPENQAFSSLDGVLYTKQKDVLVSFPNGRTGSYRIPSGVKAIGKHAFDDALLNELWIPESVGAIGQGAFYPCNEGSPYGIYQPLTKIYYEGSYEEVSNLYDRLGYYNIDPDGKRFEEDIDNIYFLAPDCQIGSEKTKYTQDRYEEIKPIESKNGSADQYEDNVSYVGGELTYQWYRGTVLYKEVSYGDYVESASRREIDWEQTLANSELLAGATESSYIPSFKNHSKESYFCIITNNYMGESYKNVSNVVEIEFAVPEVQVTFSNRYGLEIPAVSLPKGSTLEVPTPEFDGYVFKGWYTDETYTEPYDFTEKIIESKTIYVKFEIDYTKLAEAVALEKEKIEDSEFISQFEMESFDVYLGAYHEAEMMLTSQTAGSADDVKDMVDKLKCAAQGLTKKVLQVSFNCNGGNSLEAGKVTYGEKVIEPEVPIKKGYLFDGWYTDVECCNRYDFGEVVKKDFTLYAKWNLDYSELEQVVREANVVVNSEFIQTDVKKLRLMNAIKTGQKLLDYRNAASLDEIESAISSIREAMEQALVDLGEAYFVEFEGAQGNILQTQLILSGECAVEPVPPVIDGYCFVGWYEDKAFTIPYEFSNEVTENKTLYAKWEVDYSQLEETVAEAKQIVAKEEKLVCYTEESVKQYKEKVAQAEIMLEERTATTLEEVEDAIESLQNVLVKKVHQVTFEYGGGSANITRRIIYGEKISKPVVPERENYIFDNWYADSSYTKVYDFEEPVVGDITIYAKWDIDYSSLATAVECAKNSLSNQEILDMNDSESIAHYQAVLEQAEEMLALKNASTYEEVEAMVSQLEQVEKTLVRSNLKVCFVSNCDTEVEMQEIGYGEYAVEPDAISYAGYVFLGWYLDQEGTFAYDFAAPVKEDITLYAKWELDYSELEAVISDAKEKINSEMYKKDMKFKLYKATVKDGEVKVLKKNAQSLQEIQQMIQKIKDAEGKLTFA